MIITEVTRLLNLVPVVLEAGTKGCFNVSASSEISLESSFATFHLQLMRLSFLADCFPGEKRLRVPNWTKHLSKGVLRVGDVLLH